MLQATTTSFTSWPLDEEVGDLAGEAAHLGRGAGPVGVAAGVAEVDEVLVGQQVDHRPGHGEAAEAAVEHPDRAVVEGRSGRSSTSLPGPFMRRAA